MRDPNPENIVGQKRHTLKWEINVAHTVGAVLALYLAWKFFGGISSSSSEDEENGQFSEQIEQLSDGAEAIPLE